MLVYISSGTGVDEVCRALWHFYRWIENRYSFELIQLEKANCNHCIKSIFLNSDDKRFLTLKGTLLWRAKSPFRPKHKRKNWYFSCAIYDEDNSHTIEQNKIIYQTMKSPKKGGQHVNTTCSGVRAIYPPLKISAVSYDERSQYKNKKIAYIRLIEKATKIKRDKNRDELHHRWKNAKKIERGNPVKIFEGEKFLEVSI